MKLVLVIFLLINGQWINGNNLDGWGEREQPSLEVCVERVEHIRTLHKNLDAKCIWKEIK